MIGHSSKRYNSAAMVTVHYGVFCVNCKSFIQFGSYEAESLGEDLRDVTPVPDKIRCPNYFEKWLYQRADVAHSVSPDGGSPVYPASHPRRPRSIAACEPTPRSKTGA